MHHQEVLVRLGAVYQPLCPVELRTQEGIRLEEYVETMESGSLMGYPGEVLHLILQLL